MRAILMRAAVRLASVSAMTAVTLVVVGAASPVVAVRAVDGQAADLSCDAAFERYVNLVRLQASPQIAAMFTPDGQIQHVGQPAIVGRERIAAFLESFAAYKIHSHDMTVTRVVADAAAVTRWGTYEQHVATPAGEEVVAKGWFRFRWIHDATGACLIETGATSSAPFEDEPGRQPRPPDNHAESRRNQTDGRLDSL